MRIDKARSEAAALVLAIFLLGGLLGGVSNHLWGARVWGMRPKPPKGQVIADIDRQVGLTVEQKTQLGVIIDETQAKLRDIYASSDAQREKVRVASRSEFRAILTPEQQPKYDEFLRHAEERRKKNAAAR
jgi:hypothetical protein